MSGLTEELEAAPLEVAEPTALDMADEAALLAPEMVLLAAEVAEPAELVALAEPVMAAEAEEEAS